MSAPPPRPTVEAEPIIPYVSEGRKPEQFAGISGPYRRRMGFLPNALRLYAHRPKIAELRFRLNNAAMRDPSATLEPFPKRRLAAMASPITSAFATPPGYPPGFAEKTLAGSPDRVP
jgi:hypothetical protein